MRNVARVALAATLLLAVALPAQAQTPDYEGEFFTDFTKQIPARSKVEIERTLRVAAQASKIHPMIVVVDSLSSYPEMPQDIRGFTTKLVNDWKIGDVDTHKGVLAVFAIKDRNFRVEHTDQLDRSVNDAIAKAFNGATTKALKDGDVARAMTRAAEAIASTLPKASASSSSGGRTSSSGTPNHTVTTTTHEHRVTDSPVTYRPPTQTYSSSSHSTGFGLGCFGFIVVSVIIVWVLKTIFGALSGVTRGYGRHYSSGFGGLGGGYGGGYGGGGGGGFFSGMLTGGLMGYLFGNSGSGYGGYGGYGGGYNSGWGSSGWGSSGSSGGGSYTDTTTTESWSSGGGSSDSSGGGGGFFDSFGGGGSSGDSGSGGSW